MARKVLDISDKEDAASAKFHAASHGFTASLRRILRAAAETDEGTVTSLSQTELSELSGVGRSTLAKYLNSNKNQSANPTLEVVCRLAHSLGVPPAYLLMTGDDWTRLAHAVNHFASIQHDSRFREFALDVTMPKSTTSNQEIAETALSLARMLGLVSRSAPSLADSDRADQRTAIAATSLALPFTSLDVSCRPVLLTLCAIVGASTSL